jgi:hypothetical protein
LSEVEPESSAAYSARRDHRWVRFNNIASFGRVVVSQKYRARKDDEQEQPSDRLFARKERKAQDASAQDWQHKKNPQEPMRPIMSGQTR